MILAKSSRGSRMSGCRWSPWFIGRAAVDSVPKWHRWNSRDMGNRHASQATKTGHQKNETRCPAFLTDGSRGGAQEIAFGTLFA
jgi:hypothetical protein